MDQIWKESRKGVSVMFICFPTKLGSSQSGLLILSSSGILGMLQGFSHRREWVWEVEGPGGKARGVSQAMSTILNMRLLCEHSGEPSKDFKSGRIGYRSQVWNFSPAAVRRGTRWGELGTWQWGWGDTQRSERRVGGGGQQDLGGGAHWDTREWGSRVRKQCLAGLDSGQECGKARP